MGGQSRKTGKFVEKSRCTDVSRLIEEEITVERTMSKIADQAYQTIRDKIISGEYTAGSHLKEARIAEDTGASRTPVREALRRLNAEHLVRFEPNRGAYVNSWSLEDIEELYTR